MTEIDGYTDLEEIGRGAFAVVYKARQTSVGRDVAIKLLTDPSPDDDLVRRFQRESRAVGALSWHPNIAAVVDAGSTATGQAFIVFELLLGGSLEDRLKDSPLPWQDAVASMIQVADAVEAAHRADVLHRDIKPANILLDRLGVAKLGDFGIASMQDGTKTETGMLATTVGHAAPELFDGEQASAATDVYALGSTLHTLVTGSLPFQPVKGERIATTIANIMHTPPPRPDPALVPSAVANVVAHALAKQPQYRPRSAAAFGKALQDAQVALGERVTPMPISDSEPAPVVKPIDQAARVTNKMASDAEVAASPPADEPDQTPEPAQEPDHDHSELVETSIRSATLAVPAGEPAFTEPKPFSRLIAGLSMVAVLLAVGLGAVLLFNIRTGGEPAATAISTGGARILAFDALDATEMDFPFDEARALDGNATTMWGIAPAADGTQVVGTSYRIKLTSEQTIVRVGIVNPNETELGRVSSISWGTDLDNSAEGGQSGPLLVQAVPNEPGEHSQPYRVTTDELSLVIRGVHDDDDNAGIGELIIEIEQEDDPT